MNFGEALAALKSGKRVAREGWNGMWLALVTPNRPAQQHGEANWGLLYPVTDTNTSAWPTLGMPFTLLSWIGMKTVNDEFVPWLASQTDLLAEDWALVNP